MEAAWKERIPQPVRGTALWSFGGRLWRAFRRRLRTPRSVILARNYLYDARRFARFSIPQSRLPDDREALSSHIVLDYHKLEKGLSLPSPKPGFGLSSIRKLAALVPVFERRYGSDEVTGAARAALRSVVLPGREQGFAYEEAEGLLAGDVGSGEGGVLAVTRAAIHENSLKDLSGFFENRYSVRNFTAEPVAPELLAKALRMAQKAPSVCNRQSARAYVFTTPEKKAQALGFQNGNRGFGHRAGAVIIVTSDLRSFVSIGERNQCWIDGGLFAMSLNYALHSLGLGCCMLNWSTEREVDRDMRKAMGIPDHEAVITMMAVGHLPEAFSVARSQRRPLGEVARFDTDFPA